MNVQRGDVVLVDYPYAAGGGTKVRPVLVTQNDRDNPRLLNTIVAQITSVTRRALEPTQVLIKIATPEGQRSGLRQNSVVNCVNLITLDKDKVLRKLGSLPDALMPQVSQQLSEGSTGVALDLSRQSGVGAWPNLAVERTGHPTDFLPMRVSVGCGSRTPRSRPAAASAIGKPCRLLTADNSVYQCYAVHQ